MKKSALLALLLASPLAFAQKPLSSSASSGSYSRYNGDNKITGDLGFQNSAFNFGVSYEKSHGEYGIGGYFFMQSDKEKNSVKLVNQVISFGGMLKLHVVNNSDFDAYVAPAFGIHMIKDVIDDAGKKTDKTTFGPAFKIGGLWKFSSTMSGGLERTSFVNWFDDTAPGSAEYYSACMAFMF